MISISDNCNCGSTSNSCNCGPTCVGGLTCHCGNCGSSTPVDTPTYICPHCGSSNCTCCQTPEQTLPETHRVQRLIAPSRDTHTNWSDKDPVIKEGVLGFTKDRLFNGSLEYFLGDGVHKYSELTKYAAAEASSSKKANTLVLRNSSGKIDKASLPDDLTDLVTFPDATPTTKGVVKASTTTAADNAVKSDADGGLDGWKNAIIDAIIADDGSGGLSQGTDGNLEVDFDAMYNHNRSKFEALLKSLKMQVPLEQDMDFYVDTENDNASDTIVDGRGSRALPFKTIQACVNFVTQNYALGAYDVTIHVVEGTYSENLTLPQYTRTSGIIVISADDYDHPPTITNYRSVNFVITANGGHWYLCRLNIEGRFSTNHANKTYFPGCIQSHNSGTSVTIRACNISAEYTGDAHGYTDESEVFHSKTMEIRTLYCDAGSISISPYIAGYQTTLSCIKGNASAACMIRALRNGVFTLSKSEYDDDGIRFEVPCSGTMDYFCWFGSGAKFQTGGSGISQQFSGTITGDAYAVSGGASISIPTGGLPGDVAGSSVESATYSWVS